MRATYGSAKPLAGNPDWYSAVQIIPAACLPRSTMCGFAHKEYNVLGYDFFDPISEHPSMHSQA
jgi:hypothetical protein